MVPDGWEMRLCDLPFEGEEEDDEGHNVQFLPCFARRVLTCSSVRPAAAVTPKPARTWSTGSAKEASMVVSWAGARTRMDGRKREDEGRREKRTETLEWCIA